MRYLSLFSGIEAATVAWHPLGWECVAVAEIEKFPAKLLQHYYPNVPNLGDVTKVTEADIMALGQIDLVVFGSPCQDLSVAGKRKGLEGERSGLFFTAINIINWAREWGGCRFALWENVPGAFSSNKGRDFAAVVDALAGLEGTEPPHKGWGTEGCAVGSEGMVEWSTLDAQWFGVAQRRRRVFALADFGDWTCRPPILLESESLRGDSPPSREAGEGVAGALAASTGGGGFPGTDEACEGGAQPVGQQRPVLSTSTGEVAHCLNAGGMGRIDYETETMVVCATGDVTHTRKAGGFDASEDGTGRGTPIIAFNSNAQPDEMKFDPHVSAPPTCSQYSAVFTLQHAQIGRIDAAGPQGKGWHQDVAFTQDSRTSADAVVYGMHVRRLTPRECEKLQGFPPDYTAVPDARGKPSADGSRYKALGNSMAVPVMRWIGQQIDFTWRWF